MFKFAFIIALTIFISSILIFISFWIHFKKRLYSTTNITAVIEPTSNFRILISAQCNNYQDWQVDRLVRSLSTVWPTVNCTRVLSCGQIQQTFYKHFGICNTIVVDDWGTHPETGDAYLPYNRPAGLAQMDLESFPEKIFIIMDPDVILRKPLNDITVEIGHPVAQMYEYMTNNNLLQDIVAKFCPGAKVAPQPVGMPMLLHRTDLIKLAPLWLLYVEKIRNDPESREKAGWIAEMLGYSLAAAELGIVHTVRNDLADRVPYDRIDDPYVLHYDLAHTADNGAFKWDKRDDMLTDLNDKTFPIPKNPPNEKFAYLFKMLTR